MRPALAAGLSAAVALVGVLAALAALGSDAGPPRDARPPGEVLTRATRRLTGPGAPGFRFVLEGEVRVDLARAGQPAHPATPDVRRRLEQQVEGLAGRDLKGPNRVELALRGGGAAVGGDRDRGRIDYALRSPVETRGTLDVVTVGGRAYVRTGETGGWVRMPAHQRGFTLAGVTVPFRVPDLLDLLEKAAGRLTDLGERTLADTRVRGLGFSTGSGTIELWVGIPDDFLRELTWRYEPSRDGSAAPPGVMARTTLRLRDFATEVAISHPPTAELLSSLPPERRPPFPVATG